MTSRPCIFLDRDKVLNHDKGYTHKVSDLCLMDNVVQGLKALADRGFLLIVISNQSGVGRGMFSEDAVRTFNEALANEIARQGGPSLDAFYYCPHAPDTGCDCRKPKIKLIESAKNDFNIDLDGSWMIGDRETDIECGVAAGLPTVLITADSKETKATCQAKDLVEAAEMILNHSSS